MTTLLKNRKKCALCGFEHDYFAVGSTNTFGGSADLDSRPPEMLRSTMKYWIEECPQCGYVSSDISRKADIAASFLKTEGYLICEGHEFVSDLAQRFYRQYLIRKENNDTENEYYALLHCIWACDDSEDTANAKECRKKAVPLLDEMIRDNHRDKDLFNVMRADLLRRSGCFEQVIREYTDYRSAFPAFNAVIEYQVYLSEKQDDACRLSLEASQFKKAGAE